MPSNAWTAFIPFILVVTAELASQLAGQSDPNPVYQISREGCSVGVTAADNKAGLQCIAAQYRHWWPAIINNWPGCQSDVGRASLTSTVTLSPGLPRRANFPQIKQVYPAPTPSQSVLHKVRSVSLMFTRSSARRQDAVASFVLTRHWPAETVAGLCYLTR